jgi:epidermal growth factor receptor substrate 15
LNCFQIWETADNKNLGYLQQDTFAIALKLIACAQNHIQANEPLFSTGKFFFFCLSQGGSEFFFFINSYSFLIVTPLPQIKGVRVTTINFPPSNTAPAAISPAERKKYQAIYQAQRPTATGVPAETARALFNKSKLPNDHLSQIW